MYRLGQIFYRIGNYHEAISWLSKAIETENKNYSFADIDYIFECAQAYQCEYGLNNLQCARYYSDWVDWCETLLSREKLPEKHLNLYLEALERGLFGQNRNLSKAIDICEIAISQEDFYTEGYLCEIRTKLANLQQMNADTTL